MEESKWDKKNSEGVEGWQEDLKVLDNQIKAAKAIKSKLEKENRIDSDEYAMQVGRIRELIKFRDQNYNATARKPRRDWVQPKKSIYSNKKYEKIQADPRLKEYYEFVLKELQEGHKMIGAKRMDKNAWDKFSYLMPSIRKQDIDRFREQGIISGTKDILKDSFSIVETDNEFGTYDQGTGELNKTVPVYYVNRVPSKDVSRDIASSLYQFRHMAHNYQAKSEAVGYVNLFKDVIKNRKVLETNSSGIEIVNKVAESLGYKRFRNKKEGDGKSNLFKHLDEFVDVVMFGQTELKQEYRGISLTKAVGALNSFTAISTLSFNVLQGTNQLILDNLTMAQEAMAGQFMSKSDLAWAKTQYWFEAGAMTDIGRFNHKTKRGKAMQYLHAIRE